MGGGIPAKCKLIPEFDHFRSKAKNGKWVTFVIGVLSGSRPLWDSVFMQFGNVTPDNQMILLVVASQANLATCITSGQA